MKTLNILKFLLVFSLLPSCSVFQGVFVREIENIQETVADIKIWHKEKVIMYTEKNEKEMEWYVNH